MKNQKTNLEELNYRFIKVLLNDKSCRQWLEDHYHRISIIDEVENDFSYNAWCKGLFKKDGKPTDMLICYLESIYLDKGIEFDNDIFNELYQAGSAIDLINMKTFVDDVLFLWYQFWDQDFEHSIMEMKHKITQKQALAIATKE